MPPRLRDVPSPEDVVLTNGNPDKRWADGPPRRGTGADLSPAGASTTDVPIDPSHQLSPSDGDIDIPRLHRRFRAYARAYDLPATAARQMDDLLSTPLAVRLLRLPHARLHDFLVLDLYKPRMHVMYERYLSGVTADFALVVRHAPDAANPARLPATNPALWARFEADAAEISSTVPYSHYEQEALRTQFGMQMPQSLLKRCQRHGVAPITWQERHSEGGDGGHVAVASGGLVSSSLVETPLMQRFQAVAIEAQVEALHGASGEALPGPPIPLDRTERLANSLARLVLTVESINALKHGCKVALFAGRRSSDLLYLVLQNLYGAAHLNEYVGTSSLYASSVVVREWARMGVPERERWGGPGRLVGTHAHEQVSAVQQLLAPYDAEAGRRCGLPHPVAVTPLLAHLLFLAANGAGGPAGDGATALADTFTTAAFIAVARAASVPAAFRRDVEREHGWVIPEHAQCFDLFRVWRLDSGRYEEVAEMIVAAWEARCAELRSQGHPELPRPQLMHSNLESVEHIAQVAHLDPRVRPHTLAFGTLADGFLPFLPADASADAAQEAAAAQEENNQEGATDLQSAEKAPAGGSSTDSGAGGVKRAREEAGAPALPVAGANSGSNSSDSYVDDGDTEGGADAAAFITPSAAPPEVEEEEKQQRQQQRAGPPPPSPSAQPKAPTIALSSVVMKLVQARPPRPLPPPVGAAAGSAVQLPACAVKLGDGNSGKAQIDPRVGPSVAAAALQAAREMAHGSATAVLDTGAVSAVLAEAYEAVTRDGILMAEAPASAGAVGGATEPTPPRVVSPSSAPARLGNASPRSAVLGL